MSYAAKGFIEITTEATRQARHTKRRLQERKDLVETELLSVHSL